MGDSSKSELSNWTSFWGEGQPAPEFKVVDISLKMA